MKKLLFCGITFLVIAGSIAAQDAIVKDDVLYSYTTKMTAGDYTLSIKEVGPISAEESAAGDYVLDPDPFGYRDLVPPGVPPGLRAEALSSTAVKLTFFSATDNVRVIGYNVYRDGLHIDYATEENYLDSGLYRSTLYRYNVRAEDKDHNLSDLSESVYVITLDATAEAESPQFVINPSIRYVTDSAAIIGFTTDKATIATVEYGLDTTYGNVVQFAEYATNHSVPIASGLIPGSRYNYRVTITDYNNNEPTVSGNDTFWTLLASDSTAPEFITRPVAAYVSNTRAVITFQTDEDTLASVRYGNNGGGEYWAEEFYYSTDHSVILYGLQPLTAYTFNVGIVDRSGNGPVQSGSAAFTTSDEADISPPLILGKPRVVYLADHIAAIRWVTDELSNSAVFFGTNRNHFDRQVVSQVMTKDHLLLLTNLEERTRYYFSVSSTDAAETFPPGGNVGTEIIYGADRGGRYVDYGEDGDDDRGNMRTEFWRGSGSNGNHYGVFMFTTKRSEDVQNPMIKHLSVSTTTNSATIIWDTSEITESKILYWRESGSIVLQKNSWKLENEHKMTLTGLESGASYYLQIICTDPSQNQVVSRELSLQTDLDSRWRHNWRRIWDYFWERYHGKGKDR